MRPKKQRIFLSVMACVLVVLMVLPMISNIFVR